MQSGQVRLSTGPGNLSCGISATAQFGRWAECVEMAREEERRTGRRYSALLKARPDGGWQAGSSVALRGSLDQLAARAAAEDYVVGTDDLTVLVPRQHWGVVEAMRPAGRLRCSAACDARRGGGGGAEKRARRPFYQMPTYCLFKAHLASRGVHHVEQTHTQLVEELLHEVVPRPRLHLREEQLFPSAPQHHQGSLAR